MRKKLLLFTCCMVLCMSVVACDKSSKKTSKKETHKTTVTSEEGEDDTADSTSYPTQSVVIIDEEMKGETLQSDSITVSVGDIDGFYRSYGTSSIIEYLSDSEHAEGSIDFLLYTGNSIDGVANSRNVYVNDEAYGNVLESSDETSLDVNGVSYTVISYTYTHNGRNVNEVLIMTAPTDNDVVAILYTLYDKNVIEESDMTTAIHSMSISASAGSDTTEVEKETSTQTDSESSDSVTSEDEEKETND